MKTATQRTTKRESSSRVRPSRASGELLFGESARNRPLVAFNHIPNTAGGSMRDLLVAKNASPIRVGPFDLSQSHGVKAKWARTLETIDADDRRRLQYVAGPDIGYVVAELGPSAEIFALLRDPLDLVVSAARRLDVDLEELYMAGAQPPAAWCNPQSRAILAGLADVDGLPTGPDRDAYTWWALIVDVASEYYRFGMRERFSDSARGFLESVPLKHRRIPAANLARRDIASMLPGELVTAILTANWLDGELYERYADSPAGNLGRSARYVLRSIPRVGSAPAQAEGAFVVDLPETDPNSDGKVIRGKNGWLYLAHDSNQVLDQITARRTLTERELDSWESAMRERWSIARAAGAAYAVIVPPNQHSVYPEHLPDGVALSDRRPVFQLIERLRGTCEAPFIYPLEPIKQAREERPTYGPKDTHWNDWGAFVGYGLLCDALEAQGVTLRRVHAEDLEWTEVPAKGDLGSKVIPQERAPRPGARLLSPNSRLISDNRVRNRGRELVYECEAAPSSALVFGESFGYVAIKYLSETFGRLIYLHLANSFDVSLLQREQPDVVITIINERFLLPPPDGRGRTLAETVAEKQGQIMSEAGARRHKRNALRAHVVDG